MFEKKKFFLNFEIFGVIFLILGTFQIINFFKFLGKFSIFWKNIILFYFSNFPVFVEFYQFFKVFHLKKMEPSHFI